VKTIINSFSGLVVITLFKKMSILCINYLFQMSKFKEITKERIIQYKKFAENLGVS
jgi:hypothetical protein